MRTYLQRFHELQDISLWDRASKISRNKADEIPRELTEGIEQRRESYKSLTPAQHARLAQDDKEERAWMTNQALVEDSHFNFPKLHMVWHHGDHFVH